MTPIFLSNLLPMLEINRPIGCVIQETIHANSYAGSFLPSTTVNSEFFARVLFSRNFAYSKFRENKILAKCRNHSVVY